MPATSAVTFNPAFAPKYPGSFTHSSTRVPRPVFAASAIVGTSPAADTRLGSSKDADKARAVWETCSYKVLLWLVNLSSRQVLFYLIRRAFSL